MNVLLIVVASISAITWLGLGLLFYMTMHNKPIFRGIAFSGAKITYPEELDIKYSQLKVITITDLPPNWLGKSAIKLYG